MIMLYYVWHYFFTSIHWPNPEQSESVRALWGKELVPLFQPNLQTVLSLINITWTTVTERNEMALSESSHLKYAHAY